MWYIGSLEAHALCHSSLVIGGLSVPFCIPHASTCGGPIYAVNAMTTAAIANPNSAVEILALIVAPFFDGAEVDEADAAVAEAVWVPLAEGVADAGGYVEPRGLISKGWDSA